MTSIPADDLARVLEAADRAPSVLSTRPWRWEAGHDGVELHAAPDKRLTSTDPEGRDLVISCGASLYSLEVAAAATGWRARTTRLPASHAPTVLARVRFEPHRATGDELRRAAALTERRIDRRPGPSWPVPGSRLDQACRLAAQRGVLAVPVTSEEDRATLLELMSRAAHVQERDLPHVIELALRNQTRLAIDVTDTDAAWVLLTTSSDDTLSWLRAGEALQAMWLWSVQNELALVPHSQVLEVSGTRRQVQEQLLDDTACPQLVVRVAWPATPTGGGTPADREAVAAPTGATGGGA